MCMVLVLEASLVVLLWVLLLAFPRPFSNLLLHLQEVHKLSLCLRWLVLFAPLLIRFCPTSRVGVDGHLISSFQRVDQLFSLHDHVV